jgi:hypothetical protein
MMVGATQTARADLLCRTRAVELPGVLTGKAARRARPGPIIAGDIPDNIPAPSPGPAIFQVPPPWPSAV